MSSSFDKFAILDSFLDEVGSYLPEIEANLNKLEQAPDDSEALEEAHRRAHTISGSASMMDFPSLSQVAHTMEDVLVEAFDQVQPLDGEAISLLRRSLERARLLLETIKNGTPDEDRLVAEDAADLAAFRQAHEAQASGNPLMQDAIIVTPDMPMYAPGTSHFAEQTAAGAWPSQGWPAEAFLPGAKTRQDVSGTAPGASSEVDWLSLLGSPDAPSVAASPMKAFSAEASGDAAQGEAFRERVTQPLPVVSSDDAFPPAEPVPAAFSDASAPTEWASSEAEPLQAEGEAQWASLGADLEDAPTLTTVTDEPEPSLAEMLAAFRAPIDGEWPEQPRSEAPAPARWEAQAEWAAPPPPETPDPSVPAEATWEGLMARERLAAMGASQTDLPQAMAPSTAQPSAEGSALSGLAAWQQLVEQDEQVRQGATSLKETLGAVRAVAAAIESERGELRGFLDGSKDAIDRLEDWAGKAMGLNLRQSPDHVRRYLPLSVLWVVTTRLKKILSLLKEASGSLAATDGDLSAASAQLSASIRACGPLISSVLALAMPASDGGFSATVAHFSWSPPASTESAPAAGAPAEEVRERLRAEMEAQVRAEMREQVRREETGRLRQELEIEVRQQVLASLERRRPAAPGEPAPAEFASGLAVSAPQPTLSAPRKKVERQTEQSEETLEVFRAEAEEHIQTIDEGVAALEHLPADRETMQGIRRATHTLKGAAAMMGFVHIADLAHIFEDLLDRVMEDGIEVNSDILSLILDTSEALEQLVTGKASERGGETAVVDALRPRYQSLLGQEFEDSTALGRSVAGVGLSALEAEADEELTRQTGQDDQQASHLVALGPHGEAIEKNDLTVRVRLKKLDEIVDLFGELLVNRSILEERMGRLMRMVADVGLSSTRLHDVGAQLESRFEAATLPAGRSAQTPAPENGGAASGNSGPLDRAIASGGRPLALPPGAIGGNANKIAAHLADFDELELDRYNEFHRLTRGLSEGVSDMTTLGNEMETLIRECENIFGKESRLSSSFQDQLLKMRLVPIASMVPRLHRSARAVALRLGKEIELVVDGEETEVDRSIYEEMAGALLHVVRNAVTHAIETPEAREAAGKPRVGRITLSASHEGNQIVVTVRDDGAGIDAEKVRNTAIARGLLDARAPLSEQAVLNLIFQPGFSTAEAITEESGRGVGLDVVADVVARLRGSVEVESTPGNGSAFTLKFPISVQIQRAVLARVAHQTYAIPMALVDQIGRLDYCERTMVMGVPAVVMRGETYTLVYLASLLDLPANQADERSSVLLVTIGRQRYALVVDNIVGKQEIVAKNLGLHLREVRGVVGATILGNGQVILILDILQLLEQRSQTAPLPFAAIPAGTSIPTVPGVALPAAISSAPTRLLAPTWTSSLPAVGRGGQSPAPMTRQEDLYVLVVDDSPSVRRVVSNMLKTAGWEVQTARDGMEALDVAAKHKPAAVLLDIEMPRMDGYELIATLRSQDQYKHLPLIVLTSRAAGKHHQRAMQLGADAYLVKPYQDEELINTLTTLVRGAQVSG